ncbi:hypothetical protein B4U84_02305 [Westiellopsis prolifica IICB1]|nr:hypothetical protein B4U84_02305 [Westiellopsis prolifica IICB1]
MSRAKLLGTLIVVGLGAVMTVKKALTPKQEEMLLKEVESLESVLNDAEIKCQNVLSAMEIIGSGLANSEKNKLTRERKALQTSLKQVSSRSDSLDHLWQKLEKNWSKKNEQQKNVDLLSIAIERLTKVISKYTQLAAALKISLKRGEEVIEKLQSAEDFFEQRFNIPKDISFDNNNLRELKTLTNDLITKLEVSRSQKLAEFHHSLRDDSQTKA